MYIYIYICTCTHRHTHTHAHICYIKTSPKQILLLFVTVAERVGAPGSTPRSQVGICNRELKMLPLTATSPWLKDLQYAEKGKRLRSFFSCNVLMHVCLCVCPSRLNYVQLRDLEYKYINKQNLKYKRIKIHAQDNKMITHSAVLLMIDLIYSG